MLEELKAVVEDMEEDKSPGLDGFSARFITYCWDIIHKPFQNGAEITKL